MTETNIKMVPFEMKYLEDYYQNFNTEITKYQWPDPFESIDDAKSVLSDFMNEMEKEEMLFYAILDENGKFVGSGELHGLGEECPEFGIWITETEQGKGYAFSAMKYMMDYAYEKYGKKSFFYEADVRNEGSVKLLKKFADDYEISPLEVENLVTDSGKELQLQGNIVKQKK